MVMEGKEKGIRDDCQDFSLSTWVTDVNCKYRERLYGEEFVGAFCKTTDNTRN